MPQFFFDISNGIKEEDDYGIELAGLDEARAQAIKFTGELLLHDSLEIWEGCDLRVEVFSAARLPLFTVTVSALTVVPGP